MQVVPWIFGIGHPTGFPVFTIAAGIFAHAFAIGSVAWRVGVFCALVTATAAWVLSRIVVLLCEDDVIAMGASWIFAFGIVAWTRGSRAELHDLALLFALLTIAAALRWLLFRDRRAFVTGALFFGLGMATHPIVALLLPAVLLVLITSRTALNAAVLVRAAFAVAIGMSFYLYLPLRSAMVDSAHLEPTLQLGLPPGRAFWNTDDPSTLRGFATMVSGAQFNTSGTLRAILTMKPYLQHGEAYLESLFAELTPAGLLLAAGGTLALRRRPLIVAMLLLAAFVPTAFALAYHVVADVQRYYLISFAIVSVLAGVGGCALCRLLPERRGYVRWAPALLGVLLLALNRNAPLLQPQAQSVIAKVLALTPRNAVLIASWQVATPLAYAAYVTHRLQARTLDAAWLSQDAAHVPRWLRTRPVYVVGTRFGSVPGYHLVRIAKGPSIYRIERAR